MVVLAINAADRGAIRGGVAQIGATVAIGVLLDTFVVRALLIPAITYRLGDRAWWPGTTGRPRRAGPTKTL